MTKKLNKKTKPVQLVIYLAKREGQVVPYEQIYREVWHLIPYGDFVNTLNATMTAARKLLKKGHIQTVRRHGYRYVQEKEN